MEDTSSEVESGAVAGANEGAEVYMAKTSS